MPVFQKFASVCSCQWKWKDVCFALEKISSEIQTENGTYGQIWSTWICFAKPTSSKPTRLSVLERDLMLCGARAFPFALPSACRWPPWLPALSWTWCSPSDACRWSECALLWVGLFIHPLLFAGDIHAVQEGFDLQPLLNAGDHPVLLEWALS